MMARPLLVKAEFRDDGRLALSYSTRPGRRITLIAGPEVLTEALAEQIVDTIIPMIEHADRPDLPAI